MQTLLTPSGVVLHEGRKDGSCGLNTAVLPYKYGTLKTLSLFIMAMRSTLKSSASCILTVMGRYYGQPMHYKTCAAGFTMK